MWEEGRTMAEGRISKCRTIYRLDQHFGRSDVTGLRLSNTVTWFRVDKPINNHNNRVNRGTHSLSIRSTTIFSAQAT